MSDLPHWDAATDFSGDTAAALAMGLDPAQPDYVRSPNNPIYDRMKRHFDFAKRAFKPCEDPQFAEQIEPFHSIDLEWIATNEDPEDGAYAARWLLDNALSGFETQRFTRYEIDRWLSAVGIQSRYSFDVIQVPTSAEKPLGTRERNTLLTIIAVLAKAAKIDIDQTGKAAGFIEGLSDEFGAHVSKRSIENHLKKVTNALTTRM